MTELRFKFEDGCLYRGKRVVKCPELYFPDSALAAELTLPPSAYALEKMGPTGVALFKVQGEQAGNRDGNW